MLYSKLSDKYRVVVIEKAGYGYSEVANVSRDVKTMVNETRAALELAGESGPYVLIPHSFSGIEALYWAQKNPKEICAIIGLDMGIPEACLAMKMSTAITITKLLNKLNSTGILRIPFMKVSKYCNLSRNESKQYYYLAYEKMFNMDMYQEAIDLQDNAKKVDDMEVPQVPLLLFTTEGKGTGIAWKTMQYKLAKKVKNSVVIELDCDHKVHYYKSDYIVEKTKEFLDTILDCTH